MTKRAITLLFTFLFLFLGVATAWGANPAPESASSSTTFQPKNAGSEYYELKDIQISGPFITKVSSPCTYQAANVAGIQNAYTVKADGAHFGYRAINPRTTFLSISLGNLVTLSGYNTYTIKVRIKAVGENEQIKCMIGGSESYEQISTRGTELNFTLNAANANSAVSFAFDWADKNALRELIVESFDISGHILPTILATNITANNEICKGEEVTFSAVGIGNNITWSYKDQGVTKTATGATLTFSPVDNQTITATGNGTTLSLDFTTILCCATNTDRNQSVKILFTMGSSTTFCGVDETIEGRINGLPHEIRDASGNLLGYGYQQPSSGSGPGEGKYVVAKTTAGMFAGWSNNGTPIKGNTKGDDETVDGFMIINANNTKGQIFTFEVNNLCTQTTYDFSADICFLDFLYPAQDDTPVDVKFTITGYLPNGSVGFTKERTTGVIASPGTWDEYGLTFNTENCVRVQLTMYNNMEGELDANGRVKGNDIGVDNIIFSRCVPRIMVHFDESMNIIESANLPTNYCNNANQLIPLYIGHRDYSITEIMPDAYYIVEQSTDGGASWSTVKTDLNGTVPMSIQEFDRGASYELVNVYVGQGQANTQYRAIVAPSVADVQTIQANNNATLTGCAVYYITNGDYIANLTYSCTNNSLPPTVEDFNKCATGTTLDLWEQLTAITINDGTTTGDEEDLSGKTVTQKQTAVNALGEIKWYDANNAELTSSIITLPASGATPVTYKATFTQSGGSYQESSYTTFTVQVPQTITFDLEPTDIKGCASDFTDANDRTITVKNLSPATLTGATYNWTDTNTSASDQDGNASYVVPATGSGTVSLKITATGVCDSNENDEVEYSLNEQTTITNIKANPSTVCTTNPTSTLSATVNTIGATYNWYKGNDLTTAVSTGTVGTDGKATYTDNNVASTEGTVTYTLIIGDPDNCGAQATVTVTVASTITYTMTATQGTTEIANGGSICQGTDVTIQSGVTDFDSSVQTLKWYSDASHTQELTAYANETSATFTDVQSDINVYITVTGGTCDGSGSFTVKATTKPVVYIDHTRPTICHSDTNTVHLDYSHADLVIPTGSTYEWKVWYNGDTANPSAEGDPYQGEFTANSKDAFKQYKFENAGKYTFALKVSNGENCYTTSEKDLFWVAGDPNFEIAADSTICVGDSTNLIITLNTNKPADYTAYWTLKNDTEELEKKVVSANLKQITNKVGPATTTTYTAHVEAVCKASKDTTITVDQAPTTTLTDSVALCMDETFTFDLSVNGTANNITWQPTDGLNHANIQKPTLTASKAEKQQQKYVVTFTSGKCTVKDSIKITINELPVITELVTTETPRQIKVNADAMGASFVIDQMETVYDVPAIVSDLPIGWRRIYVTDVNNCKTDSTIYIEPVPIQPMPYFSPNGEGAEATEKWTIHNIDQYQSYIIEIFDRYGRRLLEYRTGSFSTDNTNGNEPFGWDGTYNGHQMPSDDYWYLITVEEIRKQYTGHFILKR